MNDQTKNMGVNKKVYGQSGFHGTRHLEAKNNPQTWTPDLSGGRARAVKVSGPANHITESYNRQTKTPDRPVTTNLKLVRVVKTTSARLKDSAITNLRGGRSGIRVSHLE